MFNELKDYLEDVKKQSNLIYKKLILLNDYELEKPI